MNWQPIETAPIPEFIPDKWYSISFRCLVSSGSDVTMATYSYTQKGKGRWQSSLGYNINPTYWMPLPTPPDRKLI